MFDPKTNMRLRHLDNCFYPISQGQAVPKELLNGIAQGHMIR